MKKIIITGGSGFIGTNLIQYYLEKGWKVLNIDKVHPRNNSHIKYYRSLDILDESQLVTEFELFSPDYLIHLAARTDLNEKNNINGYTANFVGVKSVINASNACFNLKRIIFASSMLVCKFGHIPIDENEYNPNTLYGESKVLAELFIKNANIRPEWLIIRPTSIWGPWFGSPYYDFFQAILNGRFVHPGFFAGTATYGFVGNSVYQFDRLLMHDKRDIQGRVFYIGENPPLNLSDWADKIAYFAQVKKPIRVPFSIIRSAAFVGDLLSKKFKNFPLTSFRLKNMTMNNIIDVSATERIVGILPFKQQAAIQKTLKWMRDGV